jgi:erythronate-4-phosphate dehydrogenase
MLIVADENIPLLDSFFGDIGDIRQVPGRSMSAADVKDADILLVRSVTRVNQELLANSRVRFVGTCTIGTDHIDQDWLKSARIAFSAAPGCNANSVVEYVLAIIALRAEKL